MHQRGMEWAESESDTPERTTEPSESTETPRNAKIRMFRGEEQEESPAEEGIARAIVQAALEGQMVVYEAETHHPDAPRDEGYTTPPPPYVEYTEETEYPAHETREEEEWPMDLDTQPQGEAWEHQTPQQQKPTQSAPAASSV